MIKLPIKNAENAIDYNIMHIKGIRKNKDIAKT